MIAHLGAGSSLVAVKNGRAIDTTMGLTPGGGIPMATRSGDLDPGVLVHLLRHGVPSVDALETLLERESGLTAISLDVSRCAVRVVAANEELVIARHVLAVIRGRSG